MTLQQDWDNSRLADYLLYDFWSPSNGWCVMAGFDYSARHLDEVNTLSPITFIPFDNDAVTTKELNALLKRMKNDVNRLRDFWINSKLDEEEYSPAFLIDWALSKRFRPDWLDWAIERKLYTPRDETEKSIQPTIQSPANSVPQGAKWRKAFEYESDGLNALYTLIEDYFFDKNDKPIYEPTQWPLKKSLKSELLAGRTIDEADTIITSGKRKGKAEK